MIITKKFDNGFRLVINKMEGFASVSAGVLVKTGSVNETEKENGISHFIEHMLFKGTDKRSSFEISKYIDSLGAQINAYTSKEITCYYTKSTGEHYEKCLEVLSDLFFNSKFDEVEMEKEKGVIIEEINMSEDSPEDVCLDLLAESHFGTEGFGRTILGPSENVSSFDKSAVENYMNKYYTADNVVLSVAGDVNVDECIEFAEKYFAVNFKVFKSAPQYQGEIGGKRNLIKTKKIEQTHLAFAMPAFCISDDRGEALNIANKIFGSSMSSKLFQRIREDLGLAYSVYSYLSAYKNTGVLEIYAGVNTKKRDVAYDAIINEIKLFAQTGITEEEFACAKEQIKSSLVFSLENTSSQMLLYGKYLLFEDKLYDYDERKAVIDGFTREYVNQLINQTFDVNKLSVATVGPSDVPLELKIK